MNKLHVLLIKDLKELWRNKSILILGAVGLIFAIGSPILAKAMPDILGAVPEFEGVAIADPTIMDSYTQYIGNMIQIFAIVLVVIAARSLASENSKGTLKVLVTNHVKPYLVALSKVFMQILVVTDIFILSTIIFLGYTHFLFNGFTTEYWFTSILLLYMYLIFLVLLANFIATFTKKPGTSLLIGITSYISLMILSSIPVINKFIPGTIASYSVSLLNGTVYQPDLNFNIILTGLVMILLLLGILKNYKIK